MLRREGMPVLIKRIVLGVIVLLVALLQNTDGLLPTFFSARLFLLIPLSVCIGMYEGFMPGLLYGMAAGAFWDVCSSGADGMFALILAFAGFISGFMIKYVMRNKLLTQLSITAFFSFGTLILHWLITVYIPIGDKDLRKLLLFYLPSAVMTLAVSFVIYYVVGFVCTFFNDKEARLNEVR